MSDKQTTHSERAVWVEQMPEGFDPVDEVRNLYRTVSWIGDLVEVPNAIMKSYEASKKRKSEAKMYQNAVLRYLRHSLTLEGVSALVTDNRIIVGRREVLERMIYESKDLPRADGTDIPSPGTEAREGTGEERQGTNDAG